MKRAITHNGRLPWLLWESVVLLLKSGLSVQRNHLWEIVECTVSDICLYIDNHGRKVGYFYFFSFCLFKISFDSFSLTSHDMPWQLPLIHTFHIKIQNGCKIT